MKTILAPLVLVLMLSCEAFAQKYVIELEGFAFDRDLTEAEKKLVEKNVEDVPGEERAAARAQEMIALLRSGRHEFDHFKSAVLAAISEPVSVVLDAENMRLEASLCIVENNKNTIKLDCQLAAGCVNGQLSHSHRIGSPLTIRLGQTDQVGGGGAQARDSKGKVTAEIYQILLLHVREAGEDDLRVKKVSESFEAKLLDKMKGGPLPGGKLTMRSGLIRSSMACVCGCTSLERLRSGWHRMRQSDSACALLA